MFQFSVSGLVIAYVVVALVLLIANLGARWSWRVKAGAIVTTSALYLVTYFSYPALLGWPTAEPLPARFKLLAAYVERATEADTEPREILLWAIDQSAASTREPRAYRVPYSALLHEKVEEASERIRKGLPQIGEVRASKSNSLATAAGAASGSKKGGTTGRATDTEGGQVSSAIEFQDLPAPKFPDK